MWTGNELQAAGPATVNEHHRSGAITEQVMAVKYTQQQHLIVCRPTKIRVDTNRPSSPKCGHVTVD